jgi:hypothetical protein
MTITRHSTERQLRTYINNKDETNIKRTKEQSDKFHGKREFEKQQAKENPSNELPRDKAIGISKQS